MRLGSLGLGLARGRFKPFRSFALALAFAEQQYRSGGTYTTDITALPGYAYGRTGAKLEQNADGSLVSYADHVPGITDEGYWSRAAASNILLGGTIDLPTQNVTVSAQAYTLSFIGTGTVALSGAHVATLAGTGASDRVELTFTPAAGTLTLTVTGTVQYAGLVAGNSAGPIILTNASAVTTVAADVLKVSPPALAGTDSFAVIVAGTFIGAASAYEHLFELSGSGATNRLVLGRTNIGQPYLYVDSSAGAAVQTATAINTTKDVVMAARFTPGAGWSWWVSVDGVTTKQTDYANLTLPTITALNIGTNRTDTEPLNGIVADFRIKKAALTDDQVVAEMAKVAA